jgi:SnoaL-like domain
MTDRSVVSSVQSPIDPADRAGIEELLASYVLTLDVHDIDAAVQLFADDGEFRSHDRVWAGHDRLRRLFGGAPPGLHLGGRAAIKVDGRQWTVRQQLVFFPADRSPHRLSMYNDVIVRNDGSWKFQSRECRYLQPDGSFATNP